MATQNFKRNFFFNLYGEWEKTLTLVCFLLPLKRENKKCLTLAAYFLRLETPGLPACYPFTNNEKSEREVKESIPFTTATKRIKYLGINLPKETKDLYTENYKTLLTVWITINCGKF